jgi:hypothetical protein
MRYLKLYEDHKATSDRINQIDQLAKEQKSDAINEYKALVDEVMYDISDDYKTDSKIYIKEAEISLDRPVKTYIDYRITFPSNQYVVFLDRLLEVVNRLKVAYRVTYSISAVYDINFANKGMSPRITGKLGNRHPEVFSEIKESIRKHIRDNYNSYPQSDVNFRIEISF